MNAPRFFAVLLALSLFAHAQEQLIIAEDDASQPAYGGGWNSDTNGGSGFDTWAFRTHTIEADQSHAGFFIGTKEDNPDLDNVAINNKAFGLFANGFGFEVAAAFRAMHAPLAPGQSFSFIMENSDIEQKFENGDPAPGAVGLALRTGNANSSIDDYNANARFEFGFYEGANTYRILDGEEDGDSGVALTEQGVSVSVTLTGADTYDLEITTLGDKQTKKLDGRRLGGETGGAIESFSIFSRDGEKADVFFNGFQVSKPGE